MLLWCYTCKKLHLWSNTATACSASPLEDRSANDAQPPKYPRPFVAVKEARA